MNGTYRPDCCWGLPNPGFSRLLYGKQKKDEELQTLLEKEKTQVNMKTIKELVNQCFQGGETFTFKKTNDGVKLIIGHPGERKAVEGFFPANILNEPDDVFEHSMQTSHGKLQVAMGKTPKVEAPSTTESESTPLTKLPKKRVKGSKKVGKDEEESE